MPTELKPSTCSMDMNMNEDLHKVPLDGTLDYMHGMKIGWQGRGSDMLHMQQTKVGGEMCR